MDLPKLLANLAAQRPLFHSEKDFQHALAWEVHTHYPDAKIRLERRPVFIPTKMYVDLWVVLPSGKTIALELKYKTRGLDADFDGEAYRLLDQSAQDQGRYDFLLDIARLEQLTAANSAILGAAILLTNDSSYWTQPRPRSSLSVDAAFRIHDGRSLAGDLSWGAGASAGTKGGREAILRLTASYSARWANYSELDTHAKGKFRYLLINVGSRQ